MKKIIITLLSVMVAASAVSAQSLKAVKDSQTEKYGFVNARGDWAIPPVFDNYHSDSFGFFQDQGIVRYKGKWGVINRKGEFITRPVFPQMYEATEAAKEHKAEKPVGKWLGALQDIQTGKWGFVNHLGNWAIQPLYDDYHQDSFRFLENVAVVKYRGKWGVIDKNGEFLAKPVFSYNYEGRSAATEIIADRNFNAVLPMHVPNHTDMPVNGVLAAAAKQADGNAAGQSAVAQSTSYNAASQTPAIHTNTSAVPPTFKVLSPEPSSKYDSDEVTIRYEAKSFDGSPVAINVIVDGQPYDLNTKGVRRSFDEITVPVGRKAGTRTVILSATDTNGNNSGNVVLNLQYTGDAPKPTLYTLSIGVGEYADPNITDLMFGAKDARDVAATISGMKSDVYGKIEKPVVLTDEQATSAGIMAALEDMLDRPRPDDVVIIYMSGHGVEDNRSTYFLTSNSRADRLFSTAVKFSAIEEITNMLTERQCKVVVFMDTCHAGSMFGTNSKAVTSSLQFAAPSVIGFYSSTSGQKSNEKKEWGNSAFTRALIDGLKGAAADNGAGGRITTRTLENYIFDTVTSLTSNKQQPLLKTEIGHYILF